jgi:hypothetical protein
MQTEVLLATNVETLTIVAHGIALHYLVGATCIRCSLAQASLVGATYSKDLVDLVRLRNISHPSRQARDKRGKTFKLGRGTMTYCATKYFVES